MYNVLARTVYINFIGTDGSGKDTIFNLIKEKFPNALLTREPGGTEEAELIRNVILDIDMTDKERINKINVVLNKNINGKTRELLSSAQKAIENSGIRSAEPYLYAASRSESIEKSIQPALKSGIPVLGRRSVACSVAYQGNARNMGMSEIWDLNHSIVKDTYPTLEIFFDLPVEVALERLSHRTEKQDRLDGETIDFFKKVREGYLYFYQNICPYPYVILDAEKSINDVYNDTINILTKYVVPQPLV